MIRATGAILALTLASACATTGGADAPSAVRQPGAVAAVAMADGTPVGTAMVRSGASGLTVTLKVTGVSPGDHGVHVHTTGKCEAPGFTTAGGHWNPGASQHGLNNPHGAHAGDMPNLNVAADGTGTLSFDLRGGTLAGLLDADGAAFVIHAGKDDQTSDPAGNSGDRIACGVFVAS